ncbi:Rossmann-fold NAD(P)-binding domain-containing protein [Allosaccharopolyspora coralli]|uniref:hypothetical protein n=1 Tax=Allosaccharopolyspora coralli TaxID=2665642 RepID=UPI00165265E7|nr:hypothetical protein [Allosaccharopolyspora coralli]
MTGFAGGEDRSREPGAQGIVENVKILVLGGTRFVSRAVAAEAVARGHDVTCAARGESGAVPEGARLVAVDRDRPDGLAPLAGESFDGVVDVARLSLRWVREALATLGARVGHWTFVSTGSVYAHPEVPGQDVTAPVLSPITEVTGRQEDYGGVKVASEMRVREAGLSPEDEAELFDG